MFMMAILSHQWYKQARDVYANVQVMDRLWAAVNEGTLPATGAFSIMCMQLTFLCMINN